MYDLKQSTALTVLFFAHDVNGDKVDSLTDGTFTKRQSKNGGAFGAMTVTVTFLENGWYSLPLSTAHTDTLGVTSITLTNAGCKQINLQFIVRARTADDIMPTYTQPTGFLAATFPTGTVANTTNITAGTITTTTNLTNAPTNGDLTATMKTSVTTAATAATPSVTVSDKTGFSLSTAGILAIWHQLTSAIATAGSIGLGLARFIEYGFYQNGAVWIDTVGGAAGAVAGVNGTNRNPVNNIADANTLATALGLNRFVLAPGSSVTFAAAQSTQEFIAHGATIALGGQDISNSIFTGAIVSGIGTGILPVFEDCSFLNITLLAYARARRCIFSGVITLGAASVYTWRDCVTAVTGASPPVIDFGALIGATTVNLRNYSGHVEIQNMGQVAGADAFFMEGIGDLTINANCINNQAVTLRGIIGLTNNGSVTIDQDQRVTNNQLVEYFLKKDMSTITGEAARSPLNALRKLMNRIVNNGTTLTVYKEDDTTTAFTQTVTENASRNPIQELDTV